MIKAILFDHDGTLIDSENTHYEMWKDILFEYGVHLSFEEYSQKYIGIPTDSNAIRFIDNYSLEVSPQTLINAKTKSTNTYLSKNAFPLMPGALESIAYFNTLGLKTGIVTGASREGVDATIKAHQLEKSIVTIVSGDDVKNSKPAPDCYLLAAKNLNLQTKECIAIEDTIYGVTAATSASIKCVAVPSSDYTNDGFEKAIFTCKSLDEATSWITKTYC